MTDETEPRRQDDGQAPDSSEERSAVSIGEEEDGAEPESVQVEELRAELDALSDRHLRLAAEFDNYRKRHARDRETQATRLQFDLVSTLLEVLDDLERVTESASDVAAEVVLEGVRLVEKKFRAALETAGLEAMEVEGAEFDPETMEALMTVPTDDPTRDHRVADVFQRGYRFRGVLVRPARVRVYQHGGSGDGSA